MVKPEATLMWLTHIYMTDPFPVTSIKSGGVKSVSWSQTFLLINYKSYKMKQRDKITEKPKKVRKINKKNYNTVGTISNKISKSQKKAKSIPLTQNFPGLVQPL